MRAVAPVLAAVAIVLGAHPCLAQASEKTKIAVLDLQAKSGLSKDLVQLLNEMVLTETQNAGEFAVIGSSDIASMMSLEEQRVQVTGCADDTCLAEIGGALGVNLLVASSVGIVGSRYIINVKMLDVTTAKVFQRVSDLVDRDDDKLVDAIKSAVHKVTAGLPGAHVREAPQPAESEAQADDAAQPATAESAVEPEGQGTSFGDVAPWLTLGVAVAAAGVGGAMVGLGSSDYSSMDSQVRGTPTWRDFKDSGDTKMTAGGVMLGVAGLAAVGTLVLFLVVGDDDEAAATSAMFVPARGGGVVSVGHRF